MSVTNLSKNIARMKARHVLSRLKFDPIEKLVDKYNELDEEIAYQKGKRNGTVIEIGRDGKAKTMREDTLLACHMAQITIAEKVLKYAYGAMPNEVINNSADTLQPLEIKLTVDNEQFKLGSE